MYLQMIHTSEDSPIYPNQFLFEVIAEGREVPTGLLTFQGEELRDYTKEPEQPIRSFIWPALIYFENDLALKRLIKMLGALNVSAVRGVIASLEPGSEIVPGSGRSDNQRTGGYQMEA